MTAHGGTRAPSQVTAVPARPGLWADRRTGAASR